MAANLPSATQWAALCKKYGLSDTNVKLALAAYEQIGDGKPAERAAAADKIVKLASSQRQSKEAKANADAGKAIDKVVAVAKAASKEHSVAAEKAKAAAKQKPDLAKTKALLEAFRKLGKLPDIKAAGSGSAKGSMPCSAEKDKADLEFLKLIARPAFGGFLGGPRGAIAGLFADILGGTGALEEADRRFMDCLRAHSNPQAAAVETRLNKVHLLRAGLQHESDQFERWYRMFG